MAFRLPRRSPRSASIALVWAGGDPRSHRRHGAHRRALEARSTWSSWRVCR